MSDDQQSPKQDSSFTPTPSTGLRRAQSSRSGQGGLGAFWQELRQRKVVRAGIAYLVVGLAIMEGGDIVLGNLGAPQWVVTALILLVIAGFPIVLVLEWIYELTPQGIRNTDDVREAEAKASGKKLSRPSQPAFLLFLGAAVPTIIFGAVALFFFLRAKSVSDELIMVTQTQFEELSEKSIAVLPLENHSPNPDHAYFTHAIHNEILTNLANISDLLVIGRTSVLQYQDTVKTLEQIGEELRVRYLVEGSVFRDQNQASINIQLIDTKTRDHVWAQVYDRNMVDIMSIRAAVAKDVAEQLRAVLSPDEVALVETFPTENREAYDNYLRAQEASSREERIARLKKAVQLDPKFYQAWLRLGWIALFSYSGALKDDPDLLHLAEKAIQQAIQLQPEAHETLNLQGGYEIHVTHDLGAALRYRLQSRTAGESGHNVGWTYLQMGKPQEAIPHMEEAIVTNPYQIPLHNRLYGAYIYLGMWDKGREHLKKLVEAYEANSLLGGGGMLPFQKECLAQHDFLQYGDKDALIAAFENLPGFLDDARGKLWKSLLMRDYEASLGYLEDFDEGIFVFLRNSINGELAIEPLSLLSALIHQQMGNREKAMDENAKAKSYWEDIVGTKPKVDPGYYASLAICYALAGDRQQMEALIPKIRELTETVTWQFRRQAVCEVKLAIAYLVLGENDSALELLENAAQLHSSIFLNRELKAWFIFDHLKGNPRFDTLLAD